MANNAIRAAISAAIAEAVRVASFSQMLSGMTVVDAGEGFCVCEMTVEERHQNRLGSLHGGMTATLIDSVTSFALASKGNAKGVSVDLNVNFLAAVQVGQKIIIDAQVLKMGKSLAFLTADIREKETNKLVARGQHTKFITGI